MIFVKDHSPGFVAVEFKPIKENLKRIRQIPGARFNGDKAWIIPIGTVPEFEAAFKGEFIWIDPRHKILGTPPPPPPVVYSLVPKNDPHPYLKKGTKLFDYQVFGANFLALVAGKRGHAFLTDKVGTGRLLQNVI